MKIKPSLSKTVEAPASNTFASKLYASLFILSLLFASLTGLAQIKMGTSPVTIGVNSNLEVGATNGNWTVIQKDNGNVGISTGTPTRKLEINLGTADASGLRLTNLTSVSARIPASRTIGVITAGNVVTVSRVSATIPP